MSQKIKFMSKHTLFKDTSFGRIYLDYTRDLTHGKGWFCQIHAKKMGFGFDKKSRFVAVRKAIKDLDYKFKILTKEEVEADISKAYDYLL